MHWIGNHLQISWRVQRKPRWTTIGSTVISNIIYCWHARFIVSIRLVSLLQISKQHVLYTVWCGSKVKSGTLAHARGIELRNYKRGWEASSKSHSGLPLQVERSADGTCNLQQFAVWSPWALSSLKTQPRGEKMKLQYSLHLAYSR